MPSPAEGGLVRRVAQALKQRALSPDGLLQRASDRIAFPQLYEKYRKNFLTHGVDFLRGDDELPLFAPGVWHAPLKWRPIPGPTTVSLSRATLATTEEGTAMLRGHYGGSRGEVALLSGKGKSIEGAPVGAGACGVGSIGHWPIELAQHHWLELKIRTGARAFDLVLQSNGQWEGSTNLWRATIPATPTHGMRHAHGGGSGSSGSSGGGGSGGGGVGRGAYGVLGLSVEASDVEIREAYRSLVSAFVPSASAVGAECGRSSRPTEC